jgi:hypothetical protein
VESTSTSICHLATGTNGRDTAGRQVESEQCEELWRVVGLYDAWIRIPLVRISWMRVCVGKVVCIVMFSGMLGSSIL